MAGLAQLSELFAAIFMVGIAATPAGNADANDGVQAPRESPRIVEHAPSLRAARQTAAELLRCRPQELAESCRLPDGRIVLTAPPHAGPEAAPPAASIERRFSGWVVRKGDSCAQLSASLGGVSGVPIP